METIDAIDMLKEKYALLGRLPQKSDFSPIEISRIKSKLGPWNRALEKAGLKDVSPLYLEKRKKIFQKRKK